MRTKILIVTAAALAAGVLSSNAQVYSANIVGYVNKRVGPHFTALANPLDANISNVASNIFQNPGGSMDGSSVLTWNGAVFTTHFIDSSALPTGWTDSSSVVENPPVLAPGTGFLFENQYFGSGTTNITFVGSVVGVSNSIHTSMVLKVPPKVANNLIASIAPIGGRVSSDLQLTNAVVAGVGPRDGDAIQLPNIDVNGNLLAYTVRFFDSSVAAPYITDSSGNAVAEPVIPVASPFLYQGQSASPDWKQDLP